MMTRRHADIRAAHDAGFNACLVKPVRQTVLYESLVNVMAGRAQEALAPAATPNPAAAAPAAIRGHVLLVEDTSSTQQVALGILQISGYSVTVVNNGREALERRARFASAKRPRAKSASRSLIPLAVTTARRNPGAPEIPTVAEALKIPDYEVDSWYAIFAPAKTPAPIVSRL